MKPFWLMLLILEVANGCPSSCSCKWKNGKQTVSCNKSGLPEIPDGLDVETQVFDFSDNILRNLQSELFKKKELINLQRIYLSRCQIRTLSEKTFEGLTNLVELDLSGNLLETVPTGSFTDCPSLMRLTLSSNPIKVLKKLAFNHLSFLNTLELSSCELYEIEEGAFQGLHSLEWLVLDENNLKTIRGPGTLPQNLKGVELRGNPWECDCHIKDLHFWLKSYKIPTTEEATCYGPARLTKRVIKSIPVGELACLPDVSPTTFYLELVEGKNVSLQCHVHAIPEASVSWWFRGQILQNNSVVAPGLHLIYFVEEGSENKRSELFIYNANSEDNGTFVCSAENAAGTAQSNFTIKIIIKEDPIVIIASFPFEYLLAVAIGVAALGLVIILVIVVSILRCRRKRKRQEERDKTAVSLQNSLKCEEIAEPNPLKPTSSEVEEMTVHNIHPCEEITLNQPENPASPERYHPDLINGMECRRWVDSEGYPIDYGLPKVPSSQSNNYYRTLPCNRIKRQSVRVRYSQEAELLARTAPLYDHYHTDVRYTADGYPVPSNDVAPCCSMQWSVWVPENNHTTCNKRCASAQTEEEDGSTKLDDAVTESPDEGYEGEPSVVV